MLAAWVDNKFVGNRIKIFGMHVVVAIERGDNDVFNRKFMFFNITRDFLAGVSEVWPLPYHFTA